MKSSLWSDISLSKSESFRALKHQNVSDWPYEPHEYKYILNIHFQIIFFFKIIMFRALKLSNLANRLDRGQKIAGSGQF